MNAEDLMLFLETEQGVGWLGLWGCCALPGNDADISFKALLPRAH